MRGRSSPSACTRREKRRARRREEEEETKQMLAAMAAAYEANNELQRSYDMSSNNASQRKRKSSQRSVRLSASHNPTRNKIERMSSGSQTQTSSKHGQHQKSPPLPPTIANIRKQIAKYGPPTESFSTGSEEWYHTGLLSSLPDFAPALPNVPAKLQRKKFFAGQNVISGSEIPHAYESAPHNTSKKSSGFDIPTPGTFVQTHAIYHQPSASGNLPSSCHVPILFGEPYGSQTHCTANNHPSSYPAQISFPNPLRLEVTPKVTSKVEYHRQSNTSLGHSTLRNPPALNYLASSTHGRIEHEPTHRAPLIHCDMDISSRRERPSAPTPNLTNAPPAVAPAPLSTTYQKNEEFQRVYAFGGQAMAASAHRRTKPIALPQAR